MLPSSSGLALLVAALLGIFGGGLNRWPRIHRCSKRYLSRYSRISESVSAKNSSASMTRAKCFGYGLWTPERSVPTVLSGHGDAAELVQFKMGSMEACFVGTSGACWRGRGWAGWTEEEAESSSGSVGERRGLMAGATARPVSTSTPARADVVLED